MRIEAFEATDDMNDLVELARIEYGQSEMSNLDYLAWQYVKNPAGKAAIVVSRNEAGSIIGQYVVIPMRFWVNGEIVFGSLSLNTLTHPEYRGRGLFTKMAAETYKVCAARGLAFTLGFPNKSSYPGFVRKLGFRHVGNASVLFRVLRPLALSRGLISIRKRRKYGDSELRLPEAEFKPSSASGMSVASLDWAADRLAYDSFIRGAMGRAVGVFKDSEFCQWRFAQVPTRSYQAFKIEADGVILATCVIRPRKVYGLECAFVVDIQTGEGGRSKEAARMLLKQVAGKYRRAGFLLSGLMAAQGSSVEAVARASGFRPVPKRLLPHEAPVIVRSNTEVAGERILDGKNWAFHFGDYDVF